MKVFLVTGGWNRKEGTLDTTEVLPSDSDSWRLTGLLLPRPMSNFRVATIDNSVYLTGNKLLLHIKVFENSFHFRWL